MMIRTYYLLTKPGIIFGNLLTTTCGFFLASRGYFDGTLFLATMGGLGLVIASACVFNNYIDRHLDQRMARTEKRGFARGIISARSGLIFAAVLGLFGLLILSFFTHWLATALAAMGFIIYTGCYTLWKPHSAYATLVGSVAGAMPPVVGYCAVSHTLDAGAVVLFLLLFFWQMPHFFAIALYRFNDYAAASIPVWPVAKGSQATKVQMFLYVVAFTVCTFLLFFFGYTGYVCLATSLILSLGWLYLSLQGFKTKDDRTWGRHMFLFSLIVILALSLAISLDTV